MPPTATNVELLTGSMTKAQRTAPMSRIATGEAGIVIGTHALLEEQVIFADLGLVVVDEQHRFGVEQRAALTDKAGTPPHVLVMTATPIPRTVAMTVFGDLEISTLTELPAGRAPIQTNVVPLAEQPGWFDRVWERVREEVDKGHQVYVVCPRITGDEQEQGETDQLDARRGRQRRRRPTSPPAGSPRSRRSPPSSPTVRSPGCGSRSCTASCRRRRRTAVMRAFAAGDIDVLVATTVIEVGVDVANATAMVLLDAERFGVSQLHQLRGRVGRGGLPGPLPAGLPRRGRHRRRATGWTRSPPPPTASSSAGSTSSSAARETFSANRSRDTARGCRICACCATRRRSCRRGRPPSASSTPTPTWTRRPTWPLAVSRLEESVQSDFMEKS